jgi:predicted DNA-binding transcriptional regulator AlpA
LRLLRQKAQAQNESCQSLVLQWSTNVTNQIANKNGLTGYPANEKASAVPAAQPLMNEHQAAALLGVAVKTLRNWRCRGDGPKFVKLGGGRMVRYRESDLSAFIERDVRASTSDGGH